jgi:hypothetical protein
MNLEDNNPITEDGDYTLTGLTPGRKYLCCIKGTYSGGEVTLSYRDPINGDINSIDNALFDGTGATEVDIVLPSNELIFTMIGSSSPSVTITTTPYLD